MADLDTLDFGIDISNWNRVTDWDAVAGNNISFCSIKLTEGEGWVDPVADEHASGAKGAGIAAGGYGFLRPGDPVAQADDFADQLLRLDLVSKGCLWPMVDYEDHDIPDPAGFIDTFRQRVRDRTNVPGVLLYASRYSWMNVLDPDRLASPTSLLWVAVYNGDPGEPGWDHPRLVLHQHSSHGIVPGIPDSVDRDCTMPGHDISEALIGEQPAPPAAHPNPPEQVTTYVVRPGDNLTWIAAKCGTTVAALVAANHIPNPDLIHVGDRLTIPGSHLHTYRVQPGDVLSRIAIKLGTSVDTLVAMNGIANPDLIYAGQVLRYP